ncbi:hypothetical protein O5282_05580 [Escherichia coli]|nr:hypothetical protein [Escherichia coli]
MIYFHVFYNLVRCLVMLPFVDPMARFFKTIIRDEPELDTHIRPKHLDVSALERPLVLLWRTLLPETLRIGDAMEQMMEGLNKVMHGEPRQEKKSCVSWPQSTSTFSIPPLSCIWRECQEKNWQKKSRAAGRRIIEMSLNLEQASDIVERMGSENCRQIAGSKTTFSLDGLKELDALYEQFAQ